MFYFKPSKLKLKSNILKTAPQQTTQNSHQSSQPSQISSQQNISRGSSQDSILDSTVINREESAQPQPVVPVAAEVLSGERRGASEESRARRDR